MVKNPGEAPSIGAIRPLNPPIPTVVVEDELGMPLAVALGTTQPPSAPRKSASVRAEVQKQAPSESGSRSPHSSDDASQNERVASPFRQTPAPTDFSFLGPAAEQSPNTRSIDYMLADTGAQSSLKKIETPPKASSKGGAELPLGAPSASAATGAQPFRFRRSGRTPKSEVSQDAFALEREVSGPSVRPMHLQQQGRKRLLRLIKAHPQKQGCNPDLSGRWGSSRRPQTLLLPRQGLHRHSARLARGHPKQGCRGRSPCRGLGCPKFLFLPGVGRGGHSAPKP